jgi:hypothetical protein
VYTGLSGVTEGQQLLQAPTTTCDAINARQRVQWSGTPMLAHRTVYSTCPVRHRTSRPAQKSELQRSEPNGFGDVAGAPDCPVHHRTDSLHQTASLVVGAINNPNHPTFKSSKFSTSQPLTRARHSILDTPKRSNPLQIPHKALVISERDLPCSFELLRLDCFFSFSFVLVIINSFVTKARDTNCVVVLAGKFYSRLI